MVDQSRKEAAKQVIVDLIASSGGELRGKVRLNKAFYFAHLFYWRAADGVLTDYPIVRLPMGPCIDDAHDLLNELRGERRIEIGAEPVGPYTEYIYRLVGPWTFDPSTQRGAAIAEAAAFVRDRTAADLSEITHEHSRSWLSTPNGTEMDIYADLIDDDQFEAMKARIAEVRNREGAVWNEPAF